MAYYFTSAPSKNQNIILTCFVLSGREKRRYSPVIMTFILLFLQLVPLSLCFI